MSSAEQAVPDSRFQPHNRTPNSLASVPDVTGGAVPFCLYSPHKGWEDIRARIKNEAFSVERCIEIAPICVYFRTKSKIQKYSHLQSDPCLEE